MINIALAGNPNVGKSTVFNALTGLHQHTGNWAGKTVESARGSYTHNGVEYSIVDIPGTYSLMSSSVEEQVARDYICFGDADLTVVVADATCLERNLTLVLQILEVTRRAILCVNLMDEARKKRICVDLDELSLQLGIPVVGVTARSGKGLEHLKDIVEQYAQGKRKSYVQDIFYGQVIERAAELVMPAVPMNARMDARWIALRLLDMNPAMMRAIGEYLQADEHEMQELSDALACATELLRHAGMDAEAVRDKMISAVMHRSSRIADACVTCDREDAHSRDRYLDRIFTSPATGIPVMLGIMALVFWITVRGANYPSALLSAFFNFLEPELDSAFAWMRIPDIIRLALVQGCFRTLGWVVSVMLPPMAIFFPLFTLLEDSGYLPRMAFNLDGFFKKCSAHGKQALTTCMGFGCNACGVMGCRIIDSPRERLIAILTNNFAPCNGRFPTLIAIITMFLATGAFKELKSVGILMAVICLGLGMTFAMSKLLSVTLLKGRSSSFAMELPPYRAPQVGKVIVRSVFDRTLFVLGRAAAVAAPAGLVIWLMANVTVGGVSLLGHVSGFLHPFAKLLGMDGVILTAFILALPANEILFPIIIMSYISGGNLTEMGNLTALSGLLAKNGWTWVTAVCTMVFCLCHFPCATTLWTVKKETGSIKWTIVAALIPTLTGMLLCFLIRSVALLW